MYCIGANWEQVDESPGFSIGTIMMDEDGRVFKYLQYSEGDGAVVGQERRAAYYVANTGYENGVATSDLSASDRVGAGVIMGESITDGMYGWFQIKGVATLSVALTGSPANGGRLTAVGTTDGSLDLASGLPQECCAIAIDVTTNQIACDFLF